MSLCERIIIEFSQTEKSIRGAPDTSKTIVFYFFSKTLRTFINKAFAVFLSEPISDVIAAAVTTFMFFRFFRKLMKSGKES